MISKNEIKQIKLLEQKKHRKQNGLFVAEGPKVVSDLLLAGVKPSVIYATAECKLPVKTNRHEVTANELQRISFLQHPQQVIGIFQIPEQNDATVQPPVSGLHLALDDVQDPGNLGTIIRIADWFGIDTIYCSLNTADVWNPKVIQATMGSVAHVKVYYVDLPLFLKNCSLPIYGTLLDGNNIYEQKLEANGIIIMGNEGNGISKEVRPLITNKLLIPNYRKGNTAESLNVAIATAITCAEFRRHK